MGRARRGLRAAQGEDASLVAEPRLTAKAKGGSGDWPTLDDWEGTALVVPSELRGRYWSVFTGEEVEVGEANGVSLGSILGTFPVALLKRVSW